jgi:hypothetical protein
MLTQLGVYITAPAWDMDLCQPTCKALYLSFLSDKQPEIHCMKHCYTCMFLVAGSPLFQCQPSDRSGLVYTPNIPDFYFNPENAAAFMTGEGANLTTVERLVTYVFTIPSGHCSGPVVDIEYCHISNVASGNRRIFNFFTLSVEDDVFSIDNRTLVGYRILDTSCVAIASSPSQSVCCNKQRFSSDIFQRPQAITFGLLQLGFELLTFSDSTFKYNIRHFQGTLGSFRGRNDRTNFPLMELNEVNDQSLPLLRFFISDQFQGW